MRSRLLILVLLGFNVALIALCAMLIRRQHTLQNAFQEPLAPTNPSVKTNVVVRRQFFSWSEVESPDYQVYITNLRNVDCPEQTIRDIIIAEINGLFARRLATEVVTPAQQWWRSEPDTNLVRAAAEKARTLDDERRILLARLLGPNWESGDLVNLPRPTHPGITLDGPVLGVLPTEIKQAIQDVGIRADERLQTYLAAQRQQGKGPDTAELTRLRQQTREELSRLLTAQQLEEYLLRYSQNASELRMEMGQLTFFNATPDEFRAIFRATDSIDQHLLLLAGNTDANSLLQRRNLEQQRDGAIKTALGTARYEQFHLLHDPGYRDAYAAAQQAGSPEAAPTLYEINLATSQQLALVRGNTNLTAEQRAIELKRIELEQLKAAAQAVGQEVASETTTAPALPPPFPPPPAIRAHPYVLGYGETPALVAMRYGVSINALRAANPDVQDFSKLRAGQTIMVPFAAQSGQPSRR